MHIKKVLKFLSLDLRLVCILSTTSFFYLPPVFAQVAYSTKPRVANSTKPQVAYSSKPRVAASSKPQVVDSIKPQVSHLEIFNLRDYSRTVICNIPELIEAPNWSKKGSYLLVNKKGLLYNVKIVKDSGDKYKALNPKQPLDLVLTGSFTHSNNDHGLSPDGKWLAFSHWDHLKTDTLVSRIYIQPVSPGKTSLLTNSGPSYYHSWSPDGKTIAYCAKREGNYDIYSISVNGGAETRLTSTKGLDDGPDYSPDGHFIYFNSFRNGTMKIFRMKNDGTGTIQLSKEDGSDWFPHPSPDGRYILFLNFVEDQGENHPACKDVRLMLIDLSNGYTRMLARFTGGQGTVNVPSWSPDGLHFAFVSYDCH